LIWASLLLMGIVMSVIWLLDSIHTINNKYHEIRVVLVIGKRNKVD